MIIAAASGKGGTGKTIVAARLVLSLAAEVARELDMSAGVIINREKSFY